MPQFRMSIFFFVSQKSNFAETTVSSRTVINITYILFFKNLTANFKVLNLHLITDEVATKSPNRSHNN
jgi:hypothetical protein